MFNVLALADFALKYTNLHYSLIYKIIRPFSWIFRKSKLNSNKPAQYLANLLINFIPKPNFVVINNKKLFIHKKNDNVSNCLYAFGIWEPYETRVFQSLVHKNNKVVILGAHIGYYSIIASDLVGKNGHVYSFEPDPQSFSLLKKNINENNIKNSTIINKAISNTNKKIKFYKSKVNKADHQIVDDHSGRNFTYIPSVTIDSYFKKTALLIDLIVMDIQGAEINALLGMSRTLSRNKDLILILEYWTEGIRNTGYNPKKLFNILEKQKFKIYEINEERQSVSLIEARKLLDDASFLNPNKVTNLIRVRNQKIIKTILPS